MFRLSIFTFTNLFEFVFYNSTRHGVILEPRPRDPKPRDPGIRDPGPPSKFKSGTRDPPKV